FYAFSGSSKLRLFLSSKSTPLGWFLLFLAPALTGSFLIAVINHCAEGEDLSKPVLPGHD
ncbi:hypothetical protein, partial [Klebsiella pneumoniae]|uniref:hypothetical protein n=1 Tax=Klebsiella pneumoniae TaxID=573 RepID=UPI0035B20475